MDTIFAGQENVAIYADDIIVFGKTEIEHDEALRQLLEMARKTDLKLAKDKLQFKKTTIKYLSHIISAKGIQIDPNKVSAVENYATPSS